MLFSGAASGDRVDFARTMTKAATIAARSSSATRCRPNAFASALLKRLKLFWQLRIANLVRVEIDDADTHAVLHFACAKIMQERPPMFVLFQIFGHVFGEQDVAGIAAIHHPLRHVDAGAGDVGSLIDVGDLIDRAAVDSHPKLNRGMTLQRLRNLHRALHRRLGIGAENQRHAVAGRQADQLSG